MIQFVRPSYSQVLVFYFLFNLVGILRSLDFFVNIFPLHDKEDIKLIERDWFMSKDSLFKSQDIRKRNKIRIIEKINFFRSNSKLFR